MSYIKLITAPTTEPITLANAKLNLRVTGTDDDTRITSHIREAREWTEKRIQQSIAASTWEVALDGLVSVTSHIQLPYAPIQSVTSIKYNDIDNVEQTIASGNYLLNNGTIEPIADWPVLWTESLNVFSHPVPDGICRYHFGAVARRCRDVSQDQRTLRRRGCERADQRSSDELLHDGRVISP